MRPIRQVATMAVLLAGCAHPTGQAVGDGSAPSAEFAIHSGSIDGGSAGDLAADIEGTVAVLPDRYVVTITRGDIRDKSGPLQLQIVDGAPPNATIVSRSATVGPPNESRVQGGWSLATPLVLSLPRSPGQSLDGKRLVVAMTWAMPTTTMAAEAMEERMIRGGPARQPRGFVYAWSWPLSTATMPTP